MAVKEIEKAKTKAEIIEILDANGIDFNITTCNGCERICISLDDESNCCLKRLSWSLADNTFKKYFTKSYNTL